MSKRTASVLNSCERIRPERSRNPCIQRLVWQDTSSACGSRTRFHVYDGIPSEDVEVTNPRVALRRLLRLYEGRQYREAASFLAKLPRYTLVAALPDIPVDLVIEALPRSLSMLEALYSRFTDTESVKLTDLTRLLRVDQALWKVIHLISQCQEIRGQRSWGKLLVALVRINPGARIHVTNRKKSLDDAIEGLGKHGPIPCSVSSDEKRTGQSGETHLLPLTSKLKEELELRIDAYKLALHKIENLGKDAIRRSKGDPHGLRSSSHQRLLSLKYSEVQQRLIDNQSLLNTLEKAGGRNLEELSGELSRRVEQDKEALRQWTSLRKTSGEKRSGDNSKEQPALASRLLQFSKACGLALQLMNEVAETAESRSSWCGEFFSAVIEDERFDVTAAESSSAGYHTDDSCSPTPEPTTDYHRCLPNTLDYGVKDASRDAKSVSALALGDSPSFSTMTVQQLTDRYVSLYAHAHFHTLGALNALEPLKDATDLKYKIIFSVLVLSWRIADSIQSARKREASYILSGPVIDINDSHSCQLSDEIELSMRRQLATSGFESGTRDVCLRVISQLESTLYDYPCIGESKELRNYASACSRLAWACLARDLPLVLDTTEQRQRFTGIEYSRELHSRHPASPNPEGGRVVGVVWPGLRQTSLQGPCLYRAVVLTA